jgi:hypothetical protein
MDTIDFVQFDIRLAYNNRISSLLQAGPIPPSSIVRVREGRFETVNAVAMS